MGRGHGRSGDEGWRVAQSPGKMGRWPGLQLSGCPHPCRVPVLGTPWAWDCRQWVPLLQGRLRVWAEGICSDRWRGAQLPAALCLRPDPLPWPPLEHLAWQVLNHTCPHALGPVLPSLQPGYLSRCFPNSSCCDLISVMFLMLLLPLGGGAGWAFLSPCELGPVGHLPVFY